MPKSRRKEIPTQSNSTINSNEHTELIIKQNQEHPATTSTIEKVFNKCGDIWHSALTIPGKLTGHTTVIAFWLRDLGFRGKHIFGGEGADHAETPLPEKAIAGGIFLGSAMFSFWTSHCLNIRQLRNTKIKVIHEEMLQLDDVDLSDEEFFVKFDKLAHEISTLQAENNKLLPRLKDFCLHFIDSTQNTLDTSMLAVLTLFYFFINIPSNLADILFVSIILASAIDGFQATIRSIREEYHQQLETTQLIHHINKYRENTNHISLLT